MKIKIKIVVRLETVPWPRLRGTATAQPWSLGVGKRCLRQSTRSAPSFSGVSKVSKIPLRLENRLLQKKNIIYNII